MEPTPYTQLNEAELLSLCCWREARSEGMFGKRGVAHTVLNRVRVNKFFGHDIHSVVLKPFQFSSFNANDPNSEKWPADDDPSWLDCLTAAKQVLFWQDPDLTAGALYYFSPPLTQPPRDWGDVVTTLVVGRLTFCKPAPQPIVTDPDIAT